MLVCYQRLRLHRRRGYIKAISVQKKRKDKENKDFFLCLNYISVFVNRTVECFTVDII